MCGSVSARVHTVAPPRVRSCTWNRACSLSASLNPRATPAIARQQVVEGGPSVGKSEFLRGTWRFFVWNDMIDRRFHNS